jgi:hypothetical protein
MRCPWSSQACLGQEPCRGVICWRHGLANEALLELDLGDAGKREVGRGVICRWRPMYRWDKKARPQHLIFTEHLIFNRHKELLDNLQSMGLFEFEPKLAIHIFWHGHEI